MIDIVKLEKKYSSDFTLKIDELHINDGERVAVIGPNGSGKSTFFKLLAGVLSPDSGSVTIAADKKQIGYQPQDPYCFSGSVEKNVRLGCRKDVDIQPLLEVCGLGALAFKQASRLSGGEKQRMCFARMLSGDYRCLLLDEPLSAADIEFAKAMECLVVDYCKKHSTTLLMSTHLPSQALAVATKILILYRGEVAEYSNSDEVLHSARSEFGRKFLDQWRIG